MKKRDIAKNGQTGRWQSRSIILLGRNAGGQHVLKAKKISESSRGVRKPQGLSESDRKSYHLKSKRH